MSSICLRTSLGARKTSVLSRLNASLALSATFAALGYCLLRDLISASLNILRWNLPRPRKLSCSKKASVHAWSSSSTEGVWSGMPLTFWKSSALSICFHANLSSSRFKGSLSLSSLRNLASHVSSAPLRTHLPIDISDLTGCCFINSSHVTPFLGNDLIKSGSNIPGWYCLPTVR